MRRYLIANVNQFLNLEERRVMGSGRRVSGYPGARDIIEYLLDGVNVTSRCTPGLAALQLNSDRLSPTRHRAGVLHYDYN